MVTSRDEPRTQPKKFAGMEHDWRRPTVARFKARSWNAAEPRLFTPKSFGWGYDVNFYRLLHPGKH